MKKTKNPTACIIIIGNEILSGRTIDTNKHYLCKELSIKGIDVIEVRIIKDNIKQIIDTVNQTRNKYDYIFTTGGIGPTHDDLTSLSIAKAFKVKLVKNKKAIQIFTKHGPIAFLPISETQTSIVFSIKNRCIKKNLKLSQEEFEKLIFANNKQYEINSINKFETFILESKTLRNYYNKNILAFGDMLHQIHPLSGQGFNMTLRDIQVFLTLLRDRESLGLPIDHSICKQFENKTKHLNFIFSLGNDFIYEFFNYDNFFQKPFSKKVFNYLIPLK